MSAAIASAAVLPPPASDTSPGIAGLEAINSALQAWVRAIDAGEPYLLLDVEAAELRLMQQKALLRSCPADADSLTGNGGEREVLEKIRRYWRAPGRRRELPAPRLGRLPRRGRRQGLRRVAFGWLADLRSPGMGGGPGSERASERRGHPRPLQRRPAGMRLIVLPRGWNPRADGRASHVR